MPPLTQKNHLIYVSSASNTPEGVIVSFLHEAGINTEVPSFTSRDSMSVVIVALPLVQMRATNVSNSE